MLDRLHIWTDESGLVHYEERDQNGTPVSHCAMHPNEWYNLRTQVISTYPGNVSISLLTDYIAVMTDLLTMDDPPETVDRVKKWLTQ